MTESADYNRLSASAAGSSSSSVSALGASDSVIITNSIRNSSGNGAVNGNKTNGAMLPDKNRRPSETSMDEEDDKNRMSWGSKLEFVLSIVSYAVGLGNIWRFPYLVDRNGGGAFLIPYILMAIFEGLPLFYLEMLLGQSIRQGSIGVWVRIDRCMTGIGYAATVCSYILGIYYNVLIMWCLWYFFNSFRAELPWQRCPDFANDTESQMLREECEEKGPTTYFFYRETLNISEGIDVRGEMNWKMLVSLTCAWIIVYGCMCKGIKTSGKVVYFTAVFPYIVMLIFFVRAMTLDGIGIGLSYLFTPKVEKLIDPAVWLDAACQIFYSFGLAFGGLIAFASYNKRENNCKKDALGVSICNVITALFAAVIIFSVLGHKATKIAAKCNSDNRNFLQQLVQNPNLTLEASDALIRSWTLQISTDSNSTMWEMYIDYQCLLDNATMLHWNATDRTKVILQNELAKRFWSIDPKSLPRGVVYELARCEANETSLVSLDQCDPKNDLQRAGSGTGLAFIAFTQAIVEFPIGPIWSVLFFLMLLALGLGSEFGTLEGVATNVIDSVTDPKSWLKKRWFVSALLCSSSYAVGLLFTFSNGFYFVDIFDTFGASFPLLIIALFEASAAIFICGYDRLNRFARRCHGKDLEFFWKFTWHLAPFLLGALFIASIVSRIKQGMPYKAYRRIEDFMETTYPGWVYVIGSILVVTGVSMIPIFAIYYWLHPDKRFRGRRRRGHRAETASSTMPLAFQSGVSICSEDSMMMNSDEMVSRAVYKHVTEAQTNTKARSRNQSKHEEDLESISSGQRLGTVDGIRVDFLT